MFPQISTHSFLLNGKMCIDSYTCNKVNDFWNKKKKKKTLSVLKKKKKNEIPGLISFRMDWLDLLVVQGTLKNLLQHHSSKASLLQHSAFFRVQLSHLYMTTGKIIALTKQTFVGKVNSLLFNMLSSLVITFLPRSSVQFSHSVMSDSL